MCRGSRHERTNFATDSISARSSRATCNALLPVLAAMASAARSPEATSRTARVIRAPMRASARAVSKPIPEEAPVTIALRPVRSIPPATSAAVLEKPKGVLMRLTIDSCRPLRGDQQVERVAGIDRHHAIAIDRNAREPPANSGLSIDHIED